MKHVVEIEGLTYELPLNCDVVLSRGTDGNIFFIIGKIQTAMRRAGYSEDVLRAFSANVRESKDYDEALRTCMRWVNVK